ncbi:MAG: YeeE/YedE thiosulfate transporter family protein [Xanthomonadales bacterium]|jgi:rhodanese-related sulfurtransferase|nr:YeeE/YedE thiosulfate transporter family protein [Xanthomonadales bacterium]
MTSFPLPLAELLGHYGSYMIYLLVGLAFGATLETAGFGNSKKLAAQFYFKDLTVFKVMFTAIIVACVLIFLSSAVGLLDYNLVWVPPTYLWPGIVGGLIMGAGFIVGGFCPGTSLVAMATGKIDGVFFVLGVLTGIFLFGESVSNFAVFFESSYMGRFTLPELFGVSYGAVVVAVVAMALLMFWGAEAIEARVGGPTAQKAPRLAVPAAGGLLVLALAVMLIGQPDNADRWNMIADEQLAMLDERAVQIEPAELLDVIHNAQIKAVLLDVRDERHYNQFHVHGARRLSPEEVINSARELILEPANTVFVTMSNDETAATEAWRALKAESVPNVYILDGGVNNWIRTYSDEAFVDEHLIRGRDNDQPAYRFDAAIGARHPAAEPNPEAFEIEFEPKVKLELKRAPTSGGCG